MAEARHEFFEASQPLGRCRSSDFVLRTEQTMNRQIRHVLGSAAASLVAAFAPLAAHAEWGNLNMPVGVTELSKQIHALHMTIFWWCVAIGVFVFGWMIWSLVAFRKSKGAVADTSITHSTKAEIIWTLIPVVILVIMAIPAARTLIAIEDTRNTELSIKVTGYQWKWHYDYLGEDVKFFSALDRASDETRQLQSGLDPKAVPDYLLNVDKPLVVPEDTKVRLLLTAQDVIHAWWVPQFGMKKRRHSGRRQRIVVQGRCRQDGHLPWPVRRTLRPRSRLHADRGQGRHEGRVQGLGRRPENGWYQRGRSRCRGRADGCIGRDDRSAGLSLAN